VRGVLHKWEKFGRESLWEKPGRGGKQTWKEEDLEFLEECLKKEPRKDSGQKKLQWQKLVK